MADPFNLTEVLGTLGVDLLSDANKQRYRNVSQVAICTSALNGEKRAQAGGRAIEAARECSASLKESTNKGWLGDYAITLLALQQIQYRPTPDGRNTASDKVLGLADALYDLKDSPIEDKKPVSYICPTANPREEKVNGNGTKVPFMDNELIDAIFSFKRADKIQAIPGRCLPVDKSIAAAIGYADAQLNMDRYLVGKNGQSVTLTQAVKDIQETNTYESLTNAHLLCLANHTIPENKSECYQASAKLGVWDAYNSGVRYRGTEKVNLR